MMGELETKARENFRNGYNCSQAVLLACCEKLGMDQETAAAISSSFGGGIGRLREVCGAISGACMAIGLRYGNYDVNDNEAKAEHYRRIQAMVEPFRLEMGSIICRELLQLAENAPTPPKPEQRTQQYYKTRPCEEFVACAARILETML